MSVKQMGNAMGGTLVLLEMLAQGDTEADFEAKMHDRRMQHQFLKRYLKHPRRVT